MRGRMNHGDAIGFLETSFNVSPDAEDNGVIEATVAGVDVEQASKELESYLSILPDEIDPDSITITADRIEGSDMDCVSIKIKTGDQL